MRFGPLIIAVIAACGGTAKPPQPAPVSEPRAGESATAKPPPAAPPAAGAPADKGADTAAPAPSGPLEAKIPAAQSTVTIVSDGKGKKEALRYTARPGAKQTVELALDFAGKQDADAQIVPTIVLLGQAETRSVDKDGNAEYLVTVTGTDARAVTGSQIPLDNFKAVIALLSGLTIGGTLGASGAVGDTTLRLEHPPEFASDALDLIEHTLPVLPALPRQPIGVGAKWQSSTTTRIGEFDIQQVTEYEVVAHKGASWTIKGTTTVSGKDQDVDGGKVSGITGRGTSETTIVGGALYPTHKASTEIEFTASEKNRSAQSAHFSMKLGSAVAPTPEKPDKPQKPQKPQKP
jgi:hypothetical protein